MNNLLLRSPSKLFATSLVMALSLGALAAFSSSSEQHEKEPQLSTASVFSSPTARRSSNVEISSRPQEKGLSETLLEEEPQHKPLSSSSKREQLEINLCHGKAGDANLRGADQILGVVSRGTVVDLTGVKHGEWIQVSAQYWPDGETQRQQSIAWIHQCWVSPEFLRG